MKQLRVGKLDVWQFDCFSADNSVKHFVTDRNSLRHEHEFTLSYSSHPNRAFVQSNRNELADAMGIPSNRLFFPSQVHRTKIVEVHPGISLDELQETDALITSERGICIAVMSADCVPILIHDKTHGAVAAVHSGWKGTVARILEKTLHRMQDLYGTHGEDIYVGIGPSVSQDAYEVGEEVIAAVQKSFPADARRLLMPQPASTKAKLNLWEANRIQLLEFGVQPDQVEMALFCTVKKNEHFFSARKGDTGRFAAGIMMA